MQYIMTNNSISLDFFYSGSFFVDFNILKRDFWQDFFILKNTEIKTLANIS